MFILGNGYFLDDPPILSKDFVGCYVVNATWAKYLYIQLGKAWTHLYDSWRVLSHESQKSGAFLLQYRMASMHLGLAESPSRCHLAPPGFPKSNGSSPWSAHPLPFLILSFSAFRHRALNACRLLHHRKLQTEMHMPSVSRSRTWTTKENPTSLIHLLRFSQTWQCLSAPHKLINPIYILFIYILSPFLQGTTLVESC